MTLNFANFLKSCTTSHLNFVIWGWNFVILRKNIIVLVSWLINKRRRGKQSLRTVRRRCYRNDKKVAKVAALNVLPQPHQSANPTSVHPLQGWDSFFHLLSLWMSLTISRQVPP